MYIYSNNPALHSSDGIDEAVGEILSNNFKMIVPQVRTFGAVYYKSDIEPMAADVIGGSP